MYEKLSECPVCSASNLKNHKVIKDHSVSQESFNIMICDNCNFQFTNPRPNEEEIAKYYQSDEYISHSDKANSPINFIYKVARKYALASKRKLINSITKDKKGRLLDYGCGTGYFLETMQKNGWKTYGIEPNDSAREIANTKGKVQESIEELKLKNKKFDVITLWHVLEHIHNLNETIKILKTILKEKGKIVIAVPNIESYEQKVFEEEWAAYDVPRHLYHFSQDTMNTLMLKHGLKIKKIYPMKLDSYYVSLLSNKYKFNKNKFLNSFITGYKSNSYANLNKNNYSSLIYIIKK
ncbi:class I SAM-dependent methyltransferase [Marivirga salinae]|uniref:Class I SAM-dependent methyltransferase n=1 Tax=Marivirga salinarum TaxID=3059078 RepID=A0AA49GCJ7_9BACT|nr:class I SAM-dependent methyltransferase [Marivirga sp. BDSF4-3]WKK76615.2 class I SAM-dependent methyltransferase [Marivirga sp. BDSF4-3]